LFTYQRTHNFAVSEWKKSWYQDNVLHHPGCFVWLAENVNLGTDFSTHPMIYEVMKHPQPIYSHHYYHHYQQQPPLPDALQRRARKNFTGFQLNTLERAFVGEHYPDCVKVAELSYQLGIPESRVQVSWSLEVLEECSKIVLFSCKIYKKI